MNVIPQAATLACKLIYTPIEYAGFSKIYHCSGTVVGLSKIGTAIYLTPQGTENLPGWMSDADVEPLEHPILGLLHSGFYDDLPSIVRQIITDGIPKTTPIIVTGHSKGGGQATQLAGLLLIEGFNVQHIIVFACPHAGGERFATYLAEHVLGVSYRNAPTWRWSGDPVPMVPTFPYVAPLPLSYINNPPKGFKRFVGAEWHHAELYLDALS